MYTQNRRVLFLLSAKDLDPAVYILGLLDMDPSINKKIKEEKP
jgi:hypothetical protein